MSNELSNEIGKLARAKAIEDAILYVEYLNLYKLRKFSRYAYYVAWSLSEVQAEIMEEQIEGKSKKD